MMLVSGSVVGMKGGCKDADKASDAKRLGATIVVWLGVMPLRVHYSHCIEGRYCQGLGGSDAHYGCCVEGSLLLRVRRQQWLVWLGVLSPRAYCGC